MRASPTQWPLVVPRLLPALFAGGAWAFAAFRLMHRVGQHDAALAAGLLVALAMAATAARWALADGNRAALEAGRCPRCRSALRSEHLHAAEGVRSGGLRLWDCHRCGYRHGEPLTG